MGTDLTTSTDLAEFVTGTAFATLERALADPNLAELEDDDPATMALMTLAGLKDGTLESVFGKNESLNATQLVGQPIILTGVTLRKSSMEDSRTGVYVVVRSTRADDGSIIVWNTGSPKIMGQIARALDAGRVNPDTGLAVQVIELGAPKRKGQNAPLGLELIA